MENTNPPMPPPPQGNYQQPPPQGGYQQQPQGGYQQFNQGFNGMPVDLPGAGGALALGILSIVFSVGFIGPILGIIGLTKSSKAINEFNLYPGRYTPTSLSRVKAAKICSIIGLSLFGLMLVLVLIANA